MAKPQTTQEQLEKLKMRTPWKLGPYRGLTLNCLGATYVVITSMVSYISDENAKLRQANVLTTLIPLLLPPSVTSDGQFNEYVPSVCSISKLERCQ